MCIRRNYASKCIIAIFLTSVCMPQDQTVIQKDPRVSAVEIQLLEVQLERERAQLEMEQSRANSARQLARNFGYSYFQAGGQQTTVFENLPVPANYVLGPGDQIGITFWGTTKFENQPVPDNYLLATGDQLTIKLWGDSKLNTSYIIDRDGRIFLDGVDEWVYLSGKTLKESKVLLKGKFEKSYVTLKGSNPTTFMDVTLGIPKSMNSGTYTIDRDGRIFVGDLDEWLYLSGKTLEESKVLLKRKFEQYYPTLREPNPITFMDVSLGTVKSIMVQIVGEVVSPGVFTIHPFSDISGALMQAGGVRINGSLRDVQVIRNGQVTKTVDFYRLFLEGQSEANFRLLQEDILFVPMRKSTVEIVGEVRRAGIYEALPGESIAQVISYAGGLTPTAGSTLEIRRISDLGSRESDDNAYEVMFIEFDHLNPIEVMDGDIITVLSIMSVDRRVFISGQVKRPGAYAFIDSLRILELLEMAGGIYDSDYLQSVNVEKIDITRRDLNSDYSKIITLNLSKILKRNSEGNILLHNHDQVTVYPNLQYLPSKTVQISGEVLLPGVYPILRDFETLGSLIDRAGRYTSRAYPEGIVVMRGGTRLVIEGLKNTIRDGDVISIPEKSDVVRVDGAVYNPGLISYKRGRSLSKYVSLAGGFKPEANRNDILVIYADGSIKPKKFYINPRLRPGAIIQVNSRPVGSPLSAFLNLATTTTQTITQVITTWFVVTQLANIIRDM